MRNLFKSVLIALSLCLAPFISLSAIAQPLSTVVTIPKPATNTHILVFMPDIDLSLMTTAGSLEPKQDWSQSAQGFINDELTRTLKEKSYIVDSSQTANVDSERGIQILKLQDAVRDTIAAQSYLKLPTKTNFEWSLGEGASSLIPSPLNGQDAPPSYALILRANGSYASAGRVAMAVGMMLLRTSVPLGGQYMQATLIDLKTGQVVWFENMVVPSGNDIRTIEGAKSTLAKFLVKLPL